MVSYDEYKKIVTSLMNNISNLESQRRAKASKLRLELMSLVKDGKLSNPERFAEILEEMSVLDSTDIYDLDI